MDTLERILGQLAINEEKSKVLELNADQRKEMFDAVGKYSEDFLRKLPQAKTFKENHKEAYRSVDWNIDSSADIDKVIHLIQSEMDGHGLNPASGGHLGYIPGGGIYPAALGDYIAAVNNHYATVHYAGPAAVELENYLIRWMGQVLGFSNNAVGNLTSGGSIANLQAIVVARDHHAIMDKDVSKACIYMSQQSHHSLGKAIRIAGLKNCTLRIVNVDAHFRLDQGHFQALIEEDLAQGKYPFLCIANLGSTDTGAVDPINAIATICQVHDIWLHVDAAYGGFFKLVEEDLHIEIGNLNRTDSITIDPHKGLFLPYGTGAVLFKDFHDLWNSYHEEAGYMQDAAHQDTVSSADISIELSRHFRGLRMWMPLKILGIEHFKAALKEKLWLSRYFYNKIQDLGFQVGPYPDLSVMIYRYLPKKIDADLYNKRLIEVLHQDGEVFLSSTTLKGKVWLRLAVLSFRTHKATIDRCLAMIERAMKTLSKEELS